MYALDTVLARALLHLCVNVNYCVAPRVHQAPVVFTDGHPVCRRAAEKQLVQQGGAAVAVSSPAERRAASALAFLRVVRNHAAGRLLRRQDGDRAGVVPAAGVPSWHHVRTGPPPCVVRIISVIYLFFSVAESFCALIAYGWADLLTPCLLYTSPSPRDRG